MKMPKQIKISNQTKIINMVGDENLTMFYDGLDEAILGVADRFNMSTVVAYDFDKVIDIFMKRDGMTYDEAYEYFNFNVIGGWNGEKTPLFIRKTE